MCFVKTHNSVLYIHKPIGCISGSRAHFLTWNENNFVLSERCELDWIWGEIPSLSVRLLIPGIDVSGYIIVAFLKITPVIHDLFDNRRSADCILTVKNEDMLCKIRGVK